MNEVYEIDYNHHCIIQGMRLIPRYINRAKLAKKYPKKKGEKK